MNENLQSNDLQQTVDCGVVVLNNADDSAEVMLPRREGCRGNFWSKPRGSNLPKITSILEE